MQILVLISGRGSNLKALIENADHYRITAVISDRDAPGLNHACSAGIETIPLPRKPEETKAEHKQRIFQIVKGKPCDLIVLAGFMQILPPTFIKEFSDRIINIHPSLLPDLPGLNTHRRALEEKRKVHGCSIHLVDEGVDTGDVVASAAVVVYPEKDSEESLSERVLEREHLLFPWVLNAIARGDIDLKRRRMSTDLLQEAASLRLSPGPVFFSF